MSYVCEASIGVVNIHFKWKRNFLFGFENINFRSQKAIFSGNLSSLLYFEEKCFYRIVVVKIGSYPSKVAILIDKEREGKRLSSCITERITG